MDFHRTRLALPLAFLFLPIAAPGVSAQEAGEEAPRLALVASSGARLFTMEADKPDVTFPYTLAKGLPVYFHRKGISCEGTGPHFYRVSLLEGLKVYVHSKYLTLEEGGEYGRVSGVSRFLNLRITPSSQPLPAGRVEKGTRLRLLRREGEWWLVHTPPEVKAWMLAGDLEVKGPADGEEARKTVAAYRERLEKEAEARRQARLAREKLAREQAAAAAALAKVGALLRREQGRVAEVPASLEGKEAILAEHRALEAFDREIDRAWKGFLEEVPEGEWERLGIVDRAKELVRKIGSQKKVAQGWRIINPVPQPKQVQPRPEPPTNNPVGYLVRLQDPPYMASYAVKKGKQLICYVTCSSGRYKLDDYRGCYIEVARFTKRSLPSLQGKDLVDVQRMFVRAPAR